MKRFVIGGAMTLAIVAIVLASVFGGQREGRGAEVHLEIPKVRAIAQTIKASGRVDPRIKVDISAHVIGKIERLFVEEGQEIEAGAPFLQLEREAFLAIHSRARAQLEIARSRLRQSEIRLADAEIRRQRAERLLSEQVFSQERSEQVELEYRSAELDLEQAREAVHQAEADLEKAADDLGKTTIYSPLAGRVITLNAEEGEVVVSGTMNNPASVIGTVADLSEILVEVDVDENEIVDVRLGQPAIAHVDAIANHEYSGRVVEIGSSGFSDPRQPDVTFFKVKVLLDAPDERLRAGMSSRTEIEVDRRESALVVPIQAVVYRTADGELLEEEDEEAQVVFAMKDGEAEALPVEVGIADATHIEVTSGLATDREIVTGPYRELKKLAAGDTIRASKEDGEDDPERRSGDT